MHGVLRSQRNQRQLDETVHSDFKVAWPQRFRSFRNTPEVQYLIITDETRGGQWVLHYRHPEGIPWSARRMLRGLFQHKEAMLPHLVRKEFEEYPESIDIQVDAPESAPEKAGSLW